MNRVLTPANQTPLVSTTVLSLATTASWRDKNGDGYIRRTEWHKLIAWGNFSTFAATLRKGAHLAVEGELRYREFVPKKQKKAKNGDHKDRFAEIHLWRIAKLDRAEKRDPDTPMPELGPEMQDLSFTKSLRQHHKDFFPHDVSTSVLDGTLIRRPAKELAENVNGAFSGFQEEAFSELLVLSLRRHDIAMVQPAESRKGLNLPFARRANFCCTTCWRVLRQSEMSPVLMVVEQVGRQQSFEMPLIQHDHVVQ